MTVSSLNKRSIANRGLRASVSAVPTPYVRPADWVALPALTNSDNRFVGLHAVYPDSNFLALSAAGAYTVDWGDGSATENIATGVQANHEYNYATYDTGNTTLCSRGYKQVIVSVTMQAGQTFTSLNLFLKHTQTGLSAYSSGFLDIAVAGASLTTLTIGSGSTTIRMAYLEQVAIYQNIITSWNAKFQNCFSLQSVATLWTNSSNDMINMFYGCSSLQSVPLFNTAVVTNMTNMFQNCYSLQSVPLFNTVLVTDISRIFHSCYSLQSVPLFNTAVVTNMSSMFYNCYSLTTVPLFNTVAVTNMSSMFQSCSSLQSVPLFNTAAVTNMLSMFVSCSSLQAVPALNATAVTTGNFGSMFSSCNQLSKNAMTGAKFTISYASCKLSKARLEEIFTNLGAGASQTITVTGNYGVDTAIALSGTRTSGSTTVTMASTTGYTVGMFVTGTTGISDAVAVTLQDTGDTVTRTAHGLANDTPVSFATLVTTTGVVINTTYYVISTAANTFQLALTVGGSAIALTTNGSGTLRYPTTITAISTNTNITLSVPASASGATTVTARVLNSTIATLKGWAVTF